MTTQQLGDDVMRPLRITARMAEPVVYIGDGMAFDGILAAAWMRDLPYELTSKWPTASRDEPWLRDLELPLAKWQTPYDGDCESRLRDPMTGSVWGWRASSVFADWSVSTRVEVRKRPPLHEMKDWSDAVDVNISAGRFKAHDLKLPARFASVLTWFAVGRPKPVLRVLRNHITALGRKVGHGNGRVLEWQVEDWHDDWSVQVGETLSRPMPRGFAPGPVARRGVRAPYWHPSRQLDCVVPLDLREA